MAKARRCLSDAQARSLVVAGRLMQSPDWPGGPIKIKVAQGRRYPDVVLELIRALDPSLRARLRQWVAWVREYEESDLL